MDLKTLTLKTLPRSPTSSKAQTLNATDPNLRPFLAHGGKLIVYHGWSDAALPPVGAINYFNSVELAMDATLPARSCVSNMVPGVQHCAGGPGPSSFGRNGAQDDPQHDIYAALEQWVEKGIAPDKIITTKYVSEADHTQGVTMTRPPVSDIRKPPGTAARAIRMMPVVLSVQRVRNRRFPPISDSAARTSVRAPSSLVPRSSCCPAQGSGQRGGTALCVRRHDRQNQLRHAPASLPIDSPVISRNA